MSNDAAQPSAEIPRLIAGRYQLGRPLGKGTYGQVFYGEDIKFDPPRAVAVKLLHPQFLSDAQSREDVRREASVLARFHHPNILRVSDFEISPEMAYIVTDFAEGGSLANKIRPEPGAPPMPLPLNEVVYYLEQIASALDEAHNLGLIHRDIKPLNILLDRAGRPLLADFGLATVLSGTSSSMVDLSASGTPLYMAPEQWAGKAGKASDIYALGVVTYQLITGQPPYQGNQAALWAQHRGAPIPALREKAPWLDYPPALDAVIAGVMAKDDRERIRPAGEFARRFKMALMGHLSTPFSMQNRLPQFGQGQSGPVSSSPPLPGSNLPPSTVPPASAPGSQPFNYPPGGSGYNNPPLPMGVITGPGPGGLPNRPGPGPNSSQNSVTNQPGAGSTDRPQPYETAQPTPLGPQGSTPPGRPPNYSGPTAPFPQPPYGGPPQGPQPYGQPPGSGGGIPGQYPGGMQPLPGGQPPVVTRKRGGLNMILLGAALLLLVLVIIAVSVVILLPKNNGPQTTTQVAANATASSDRGVTAATTNGPTRAGATGSPQPGSGAGTGQLQVTVTEASGKPAREADVNIKVYQADSETALETAYNKASASFTLPAGSYTVQATYPNDIAVMSEPIEVKEGQTATKAINLGLGTVQVEVVETTGRTPHEDTLVLRVFKDGDTSKTITTVYGKAKTGIYLPPGAYQIETGYSNDIKELGPSFQVTEGQVTSQAVNLAVGTAQVEIYETAGKIAKDDTLILKVYKQDDPNVIVTTIYSKAKTPITLKEGSYLIDVQYGGGTVKQTSQPFEVKAGQTVTQTINLGVGSAQVQVQLADGSKVDESKLVMRIYDQSDPNDPLATVYNKAAGSFTLKPGTYLVEVDYSGGKDPQKVTGDPLEVKEGQTATQTVKI